MSPAQKPNIVIIMTDQQRADVSKREGFPLDTTPFLDSLAMQGQWFNNAYTPSPLCVPARISMLTGRYPGAHRVRINTTVRHAFYTMDIVDILKEQGYSAAMVGKNHSHLTEEKLDYWFELMHNGGKGEDRTDEEKAFDNWLGKKLVSRVAMEPTPFPLESQGPYRAVSKAQQWISSLNDNPFFMWLSFAEPHNPYQVPEPYFSMFPVEDLPPVKIGKEGLKYKGYKWQWLRQLGEYAHENYDELIPRARANYFGMMRLIDDQIKRFVDFLKKEGRFENTLLIFLSDHGDYTGEYGLMRKGAEMPEILMRIPMFFIGPGVKESSQPNTEFVSIVDIMPTICEALGIPLPAGVQGRSLWPVLSGQEYPENEFKSIYGELGYGGLHFTAEDNIDFEETCNQFEGGKSFDELNGCTQSGSMRMLRKGDWKLLFDMQGAGQLYDLKNDPMEMKNLYENEKYKDIKSEMLEELLAWTMKAQDTLPQTKGKYRLRTDPRNYWSSYR